MAQPARKKTGQIAASRASRPVTSKATSKQNAAGNLASMLEEHLSELGLSEQEKNLRVARFGKRVDAAIENHAKS